MKLHLGPHPRRTTGYLMGCKNSKVQHDPQVGNGKPVPTRKISSAANDMERKVALVDGVVDKDPRSPLDSRQAFKVKQSWKGIKRNMEDTGVEMFLRYGMAVLCDEGSLTFRSFDCTSC